MHRLMHANKLRYISVTVMHQSSAHGYGSDGKKAYVFEMCPATQTCGRMPFQTPADKLWDFEWSLYQAYVQSLVLSHIALLSVTASHTTALVTYLSWRRHSTRRGTWVHRSVARRWQCCRQRWELLSNRACWCFFHGCHISFSLIAQVCSLFMHLRIRGVCN